MDPSFGNGPPASDCPALQMIRCSSILLQTVRYLHPRWLALGLAYVKMDYRMETFKSLVTYSYTTPTPAAGAYLLSNRSSRISIIGSAEVFE